MPLAAYIEENLDRLISGWVEFARTRLTAADSMSDEALRSGGEALLRAIVGDMRRARFAQVQKERSEGDLPEFHSAVTVTARDHAEARLESGFTLDEILSEYRALRTSVLRGWMSEKRPINGDAFEEVVRFDDAMGQSLTEAISWFNDAVTRAQNIFVGVLGHDLRDPLNAAIAATELQEMAVGDGERHRQANETARRSLARMSKMIEGLVDFARTRLGGTIPISPVSSDMKEICEEIAEALKITNPDREIHVDCSGDLRGKWDAGRITELLTNLAKNALEYGKRDAPVTVSACAEATEVVLSVHNWGTPISQERQATIFKPLRRGALDRKEHRSPDSMGLGLYIVKTITEAHGGTVRLASDQESGTTFTVRLPRDSATRPT